MSKVDAEPIVIVEDSDEDFDTFVEALTRLGDLRAVHRVQNGDDCVATISKLRDAGQAPSLVLMDLNLPGLDGRDALEALRNELNEPSVPIVVLSTSTASKDVERCYRLGANAYHAKPLRHDEHLALLRTVLIYWLHEVELPERRRHL